MKRRSTHHLNVVVAHSEGPLGGLAHRGKGLRQQLVERFAVGVPLAEVGGFGAKFVVAGVREGVLECVDRLSVLLQFAKNCAFTDAQNSFENIGHSELRFTVPSRRRCERLATILRRLGRWTLRLRSM